MGIERLDFCFGSKKKGGNTTKKKKTKSITPTKRGTLYAADKDKILERQKEKCAGKTCAKDRGKKLPVNIRSHFNHKIPLTLGWKDKASNIQALCANCHQKIQRKQEKGIFTMPEFKPPEFKL